MRKKGNWLEHVSKLIWRTLVSNLRGLVLGSVEAGFSSQQFVITVTEKYTICATTEHMRMYTIGCNIFWPNNCMFPKGPFPESNTKRLQRAVERQLRGAEARARPASEDGGQAGRGWVLREPARPSFCWGRRLVTLGRVEAG